MATLRFADALRAEGVREAMLPPRLRAPLAGAMRVGGAVDDRVERILAALAGRPFAAELVVHMDEARLPAPMRQLVQHLRLHGWRVAWPVHTAPRPTTTVTLIRGTSPLAVAAAAAEQRARTAGRDVAWVTPDALIDRALAARGLPRTGAHAQAHPFQGVLGRVVALAFAPQDPLDALDLLTAPTLPLPRALARGLCRALQAWPSWRSPAWAAACEEAVDAEGLTPPGLVWLCACLAPLSDAAGEAPTDSLRARVAALGVLLRVGGSYVEREAAEACERLCELLDLWGAPALGRAMLDGLVGVVEAELAARPVDSAEVGALALPALGAVVADVDALFVWNAASPPVDPFARLLPSERAALRAAGATVPDSRTLLARWQHDLQRAVAHTSGRVWLCLPDADERGAPIDEPPWLSSLDAWLRASGLEGVALHRVETREVARMPAPRARRVWSLPSRRAAPPRRESPSSVMTLLGCSLRHALHHEARAGEAFAPALTAGALLYGRLAHALFDDVWSRSIGEPPPDDVGDRLREAFDRDVEKLAMTLALPAARALRLSVRASIARAGEALARGLRRAGMHVAGCEVTLGEGRRLGDTRWTGRADLVLGPKPVVLDLKWSGGSHRAALAQGTAVQLALYAWMRRGRDDADHDAAWPPVGYLLVTTSTLVATPGSGLDAAEPVAGPALAQTVAAVGAALRARAEERSRGELHAPGVVAGERVRAGLREGTLTLDPPCGWCPYGALCGAALEP